MKPASESNDKAGLWILLIVACIAGLFIQALPLAPHFGLIFRGLNDFPAFYVGPRMLATGQLYDHAAFITKQNEILGYSSEHIQFVRLPSVALMWAPLSHLPYRVAYTVWQTISLLALVLFVILWPVNRAVAALLCCWFPPVALNFANAQDVTHLLLWIALAALLVSRKREFAAGLVLSLCAAKFHLCLFLPVLIVARKMWRFGAGLAAGVAVLLAVSFFAAGPGWPQAYLASLRSPEIHPDLTRSSLMAIAATVLHGPALWLFAGMLIGLAALVIYRFSGSQPFAIALGAALAAGPIVSFHVYIQDYLVMLPLILTLANRRFESALKDIAPVKAAAQ